jgi:hypothetical protein
MTTFPALNFQLPQMREINHLCMVGHRCADALTSSIRLSTINFLEAAPSGPKRPTPFVEGIASSMP